MTKTAVYSWRLSPDLKESLEEMARAKGVSVAELLDELARAGLEAMAMDEDEVTQRRLQGAAAPYLGAFAGGDPLRGTEAKQRVRARLRDRRSANE